MVPKGIASNKKRGMGYGGYRGVNKRVGVFIWRYGI